MSSSKKSLNSQSNVKDEEPAQAGFSPSVGSQDPDASYFRIKKGASDEDLLRCIGTAIDIAEFDHPDQDQFVVSISVLPFSLLDESNPTHNMFLRHCKQK